jgi:hypothetical protein
MEDLAFDEMRRGWDLIKGRCTDTRNNSFQKCSVHRQRFGGHGITFSLSKPHYRPRQRRGGGARYVCGESIIIAISLNANLCVRDCNSRHMQRGSSLMASTPKVIVRYGPSRRFCILVKMLTTFSPLTL